MKINKMITIVFMIISFFLIVSCSHIVSKQEILAKELGVKVEDYPYPESFPFYYYYSILEPGMSKKEVQEIVRGQKSVYFCGDLIEVYYFYSTDKTEALRFEIIYDKQGNYVDLFGEDDNSRTINVNDCQLGQNEKK